MAQSLESQRPLLVIEQGPETGTSHTLSLPESPAADVAWVRSNFAAWERR
ncbi:MAG: hypothetical protein ACOYEV_18305 [Candidatus Nanopelagicales bacterium]